MSFGPVRVSVPVACGKPVSLAKITSTKPLGVIDDESVDTSSNAETRVANEVPWKRVSVPAFTRTPQVVSASAARLKACARRYCVATVTAATSRALRFCNCWYTTAPMLAMSPMRATERRTSIRVNPAPLCTSRAATRREELCIMWSAKWCWINPRRGMTYGLNCPTRL